MRDDLGCSRRQPVTDVFANRVQQHGIPGVALTVEQLLLVEGIGDLLIRLPDCLSLASRAE